MRLCCAQLQLSKQEGITAPRAWMWCCEERQCLLPTQEGQAPLHCPLQYLGKVCWGWRT